MNSKIDILSQIKEIDRVLSDCAIKLEAIKDIRHPGVLSISTNFVILNEMSEIIQEDFRAGRILEGNTDKVQLISELKIQSDDLNRIITVASEDLLS